MQKVVDLMVAKGGLTKDSVFIDVGAGLGKPNFHLSIDPGVKYSVGIEMEHVRWLLSLHNLKHYLEGASTTAGPEAGEPSNVIFMHGDAMQAKSFDPFTHVYMFDIGFPPKLFLHLAECLRNSSTAEYCLCFHGPHVMVDNYGFDLALVEKIATSMHGASQNY